MLSPTAAFHSGQQLPQSHQGGALLPSAREDGSVHIPRVADEIGAGEEGTHGVAQEKVGDAGVLLAHAKAQGVDVLHHQRPAVLGGKVSPGTALGQAVAQVVLPAYQKTVLGPEAGGLVVAAHVLPHAVD